MRESAYVRVSVACAARGGAFVAELALPAGATVADAIGSSGIRAAVPGIDIRAGRVGIFARKVRLDTRLRDGDRVEIYRPLKVDPREARRRRAGEVADVAVHRRPEGADPRRCAARRS